MTAIRKPMPLLVSSLLLLLLASLSLTACRRETTTSGEVAVVRETTTSGEVGLVWEAWNLVKVSYVERDTLDSEEAVGNMILKMLEASEQSTYPFLTELGGVRGQPPSDVPAELVDVWKAWTLAREKWPDVEPKLLADSAIEGMIQTLGDDYVVHLTSEAYDRAQERLKGNYQGIGASIGIMDDKIVLAPMADRPAARAGLKAGDLLMEVDGEPVEGKSVQEIVDQVRGIAGTKVKLLIERSGEEEPLEINVIRGNIDMVSVERRLLPGAIGYIYISEFQETTPDEVLDVLEELQRVDMLALVLDLRGNPGGSIESAQKVVSQFLPDGLFMYEIDTEGNRKDWPVEEGGIATEQLPMVVIVNGLTASAAEAIAGALQDLQRAKILGTRTLGKGSASVFKKLSDGSAIYLPTSYWYTPLGGLIQGTGMEPDIEVALTPEDRLLRIDTQLMEAYQYLDNLLPDFR